MSICDITGEEVQATEKLKTKLGSIWVSGSTMALLLDRLTPQAILDRHAELKARFDSSDREEQEDYFKGSRFLKGRV